MNQCLEENYDIFLQVLTVISELDFWPQLSSVNLHFTALLTNFYQLISNIIASVSFKPTKQYIVRNAVTFIKHYFRV